MPLSPAWLLLPLGVAIVCLALLDMGLAVLHVERESPLSNYLARGVWRLLVWCGRHLPEARRGHLLSWGIPLLVGGTIAFWMSLFVTGFGLIFAPAMATPGLFLVKDRTDGVAIGDGLYFSAVSFLTVGYGDLVPEHPLLRLAAMLEGAAGLLTVSLSVAYVVAVFPVITRKIVLATSLNQEMGGRTDGMELARRYLSAGRSDALMSRLSLVTDELLFLGQAHSHYPLLFFVRPRQPFDSFVRLLAMLQGIASLAYLLDPHVHAEVVADPRMGNLEEGLLTTLHGLEESVHMRVPDDLMRVPDVARARADFDTLRETARRCGLTPVPAGASSEAALRGYARLRQATEPYIRAYARLNAYDPDQVWAVYDRYARDAAPTAVGTDAPLAETALAGRPPETAPLDPAA